MKVLMDQLLVKRIRRNIILESIRSSIKIRRGHEKWMTGRLMMMSNRKCNDILMRRVFLSPNKIKYHLVQKRLYLNPSMISKLLIVKNMAFTNTIKPNKNH